MLYRQGSIGVGEYLRLQRRIEQRFSLQSVNAADLRLNIAGLNQNVLALVQSYTTLGRLPIPPLLLARGLGAAGVGVGHQVAVYVAARRAAPTAARSSS